MYAKNENTRCAMASTTKIMSLIIAVEKGNLGDVVTISQKAAGTGGSRLGLKTGDTATLNDLLYGLMLRSGNDSAVAIAEHIGGSVEGFAKLMNEKSEALNLKDTHFVTPHGLDNADHYTTARELALITEYAINIPKIREIVGTKTTTITISGYPMNINNTNELLGYLDGVNGVKTGFTNNAGRCLVTSVSRNSFDIICVVLGADTKKIRTKDSIVLTEYCYNKYELIDIGNILKDEFENWKTANGVTVEKAKEEIKLSLEKSESKIIPVDKNKIKDITSSVKIVQYTEAPVLKGQILGEINIKLDDEILTSSNIICLEEVKRKEPIDYFVYIFSNLSTELEKIIW